MRAILLSVQPKHCRNILNLIKKIEIRKSMPKCDLPVEVYLYCTKSYKSLRRWDKRFCDNRSFYITDHNKTSLIPSDTWNGKIAAKFTLREISQYDIAGLEFYGMKDILLQNACLTEIDLKNYVGDKEFYGWKITDLVVFDEPMELGEFYNPCFKGSPRLMYCLDCKHYKGYLICNRKLSRPPQSWQYVEVEKAQEDDQ